MSGVMPHVDVDLSNRRLNDGEAEIMLIDLDKQHKTAADYYKHREACLAEIKNSKGSTNKINDFQRLIAERDFIYSQEEEYLKDLNNMQGLYLKKKDMDAKGQRPPVDLLDRIKSLIGDLKAKKNRIESQKVQFVSKFEKKKFGTGESMLNASTAAGLSLDGPMLKGVEKEMQELSIRMNRLDDMKNDHRRGLLENSLEVDPKIVSKAQVGGAFSYAQSKLNEIMGMQNIENRAKNLIALRTSMEILNNTTGNNMNRPTVSLDGIMRGVHADASNPSLLNSMNRLASAAGGQMGDSIDNMMKAQGLQQSMMAKSAMLNNLGAFNSNAPMANMDPLIPRPQGLMASAGPGASATDPWNDMAAKAAVKVAHEKINRTIKECRQSIEDVRLALQLSNDRMQDRSVEENALKKTAQRELEVTQALALVPYSKEMYEYKVAQINKIAEDRRELEKLLLEQRLANRVGGPKADKDYQERQQRIKEELRRAMGEKEEVSGAYSKKLGFDLHFDFIKDLPEMHQSCQVIFGIYKQGLPVMKSLKTDPHMIELTSEDTKRSLFGEKKNITGVEVGDRVLLFFELQFTNRLDKFQQGASFGWTALELFTEDKTLKIGRFKLPFYAPPLDVQLTKERITLMQPLPETHMYVRINHPSFQEEKTDFNMFSDLSDVAYTVPLMHDLKDGEVGKTDEVDAFAKMKKLEEDNRNLEEIIENQKNRLEELIKLDEARYLEMFAGQHAIYSRLNKDPFAAPDLVEGKAAPADEAPAEQPGEAPPEQPGEAPAEDDILGLAKDEKPTKGLKVTFVKLEKILGKKDVSVKMKVFFDSQEMSDERGELIEFTSEAYPTKAKTDKKPEDVALKDIVKTPYNFQGLFNILKKKKIKKNCFIQWQIMREDKCIAWTIFPLSKLSKLRTGLQKEQLYEPPCPNPPIEEKALKKAKEVKKTLIHFKIEESIYNIDDLEGFFGGEEEKPKKKDDKKKDDKKDDKKKDKEPKEEKKKLPVAKKPTSKLKDKLAGKAAPEPKKVMPKDGPFIKSNEPQHSQEPFDEKRGIDILVDQLRFLPNNVTVTKILVRVCTKDFVDLVPPSACIPDLESLISTPVYYFRMELRKEVTFDKEAFLFLIYITIDEKSSTGVPNIVGYSFFPLFLEKEKGEPATKDTEEPLLHDGQYQLPVFCQDYPYSQPFDMTKAMALERIPSCSVLIRVRKPAVNEEGEPLGIDNVEKDKWAKDVWPPFKSYRENFYYCTKYMSYTAAEQELYGFRFKNLVLAQKIIDIVKILVKSFQEDIEIPVSGDYSELKEDIETFIDKRFYYNPDLTLLDPRFIYPYNNKQGFSIAVDSIFQPPNPGFYQIVMSMNPPASFYNEPPSTEQVKLVYQIDWQSSQSNIGFLDGYFDIRGLDLPSNSQMIFSIKEIVYSKDKTGQSRDIGFTIIPLIDSKGYLYTGCYQMPLFKKDLTKGLAEDLQKEDPWKRMVELLTLKDPKTKKPTAELLTHSSLIIRLKDNFYDKLYEQPFDTTRMKYFFLPENKIPKYIYDMKVQEKLKTTKKMQALLPKGAVEDEFNELLKRTMGLAYNVTFDENEAEEKEKPKEEDENEEPS